jgi:hypothetical protein
MAKRRTPTPGQLEAAIEGAKNMPEVSKGAGRIVGPGESSLYPTASDPSRETGGPRGSGYPPSRTSGLLMPDGDPRGIDPDEAIKRETALFEPGTGRKARR